MYYSQDLKMEGRKWNPVDYGLKPDFHLTKFTKVYLYF